MISTTEDPLLADYEAYLATKKRQARRTVRGYMNDIRKLKRSVSVRRGGGPWWSNVTLCTAQKYLGNQFISGKPRRSVNHMITSLRLFFDYLIVREKLDANPFREIDHLKLIPQPPDTLSATEIARLVGAPMIEYEVYRDKMAGRQPRKFGKFIFIRDQLVLEILYYTGVKVSEITALRSCDMDRDSCTVSIRGSKGRAIPVPDCVMVTFSEYLTLRNDRWPRLGRRRGAILLRNDDGGRLTGRSVRRIVKRYALKSGVHPEVTPTTIRDTFAAERLGKGAFDETLQYILGFEDLSSALSYLARFTDLGMGAVEGNT